MASDDARQKADYVSNPNVSRTLLAFTAIAWYNAVELFLLVFVVFRKYSGLYFWSLLITSLSIIPYQCGAWLDQLHTGSVAGTALLNSGWLFMINGQSIVLWSRLHLVTQNARILNALLLLICVDAVVLCIPTTVLTYGSAILSAESYAWVVGYAAMEKIQMTIFALQEVTISLTYLFSIRRILRVAKADSDAKTKKLMREVIAVNFFLIAMDGALVAVEYATFKNSGFYAVETNLKGLIYSVKLKLEFAVLSRLIRTIKDSAPVRNAVVGMLGELQGDMIPLGPVPSAHLKKPPSTTSIQVNQPAPPPSLWWAGAVVHNDLAIVEEEVPTNLPQYASMYSTVSDDVGAWQGPPPGHRESWNAVDYPGRLDRQRQLSLQSGGFDKA